MEYFMSNRSKYDRFYESVKDFVLKTNLATPSDMIGSDEHIILKTERTYNIQFPLSFRVFLEHFGEKIKIKRIEGELDFSLNAIKKAMNEAQDNHISDFMRKNVLNDFVDEEIKTDVNKILDVDNVVYVSWDSMRQGLGFIDSSKENPILYYLMEFNLFISVSKSTFTNHIRGILFWGISQKFYDNDYSTYTIENDYYRYGIGQELKIINFEEIEWAKVFTHIFKNNLISSGRVIRHRNDFCALVSEIEEAENRIFTIDEFEWAFIAYLREQGYEF